MNVKKLLSLAAAGAVVGAGLATSGPASAQIAHDEVVREVPGTYTPHLAASANVARPLAYAIVEHAGSMYVGGRFEALENSARTTTYTRSNLAAFNETTGVVSSTFRPSVDGTVYSVLGVGDSVYVGGQFTTVNGVTRPIIAKLDAETGALDPTFKPSLNNGRVSEIRFVNGRLLVSGTFSARLLALNPSTGKNTGYISLPISGVVPLGPTKTEVYRFAVNPQGTRLVGVGNFTTVNGQNRHRAFMLNLGDTAASLNPWYYRPLDKKCEPNSPSRQPYLRDVDFSPDGSYFAFVSTGFVPATSADIGVTLCDAAARFETNVPNPTRPTWINYTGGDTLHAVAITGAAVYVQGHNRWLDNPLGRDSAGPGAVARPGIGAINPSTGKALAWNPRKPAAQGGQDFLVTPEGLWVVSDSLRFNGEYHRGIAFAPLP